MREPSRYSYAGPRSNAEAEGLPRFYRVIRERAWLIVLCTLIAVGAAVAYVKVAPRTYQAQANLLVQPSSAGDPVLSALPVLHSSGDPTQDVLTAASLVTTPQVAQAVVRSQRLRISPQAALNDVSANPIGQAGLVAVQATSSTPRLAQKLANGFVTQAIAVSTATLHAAISSELPGMKAQLATIPPSQRYGAGSLGQQVIELEQLLRQNNPTLMASATATLPTSPSSPKTKLSLIAGLIAGLLIGIGAAFGVNAIDPRVRRDEQLRELLGMPILARIGRERRHGRSTPLLPHDLSFPSQEGYRTLRTTLAARGSSESGAYLVTGTGPSEGKSTTAISLAVAVAQTGARVVLLEADLRRPTFAGLFALTDFVGVEAVLGEEASLAAAVNRVTVDGTDLDVVAAHSTAAEFVARLSYESVRRLVSEARAIADFVIIDSPPLTTVIDALPFAQVSDEIVIVARMGRSRLNKLVELDELLRQHGMLASGLVVVGESNRAYTQYGGYLTSTPKEPAPEPTAGWAEPRVTAAQGGKRRLDVSSLRRSPGLGTDRPRGGTSGP